IYPLGHTTDEACGIGLCRIHRVKDPGMSIQQRDAGAYATRNQVLFQALKERVWYFENLFRAWRGNHRGLIITFDFANHKKSAWLQVVSIPALRNRWCASSR